MNAKCDTTDSIPNDIILTGPYGAGKSTIAELISRKLGWALYSLDDEYYCHLRQMKGFDNDLLNQMNTWELTSPQWQPYHLYVIERFLSDHTKLDEHCVFDFGVGHTIYNDGDYLERAKQLLAPYNVTGRNVWRCKAGINGVPPT